MEKKECLSVKRRDLKGREDVFCEKKRKYKDIADRKKDLFV